MTLRAAEAVDPPVVRIRPSKGWSSLGLAELATYRELLFFLALRDVKVRYKQTVLGVAWAVIQPTFAMIIFSIFLGRLARVPSDGLPYPVFAYAGLVPWMFFANALSQASNSLVGSANLLRKVYFPRLILPLSTVLAGVLDLGLTLVALVALMAFYGIYPTGAVMVLPLYALLAVTSALGMGLWLSALNVEFRDVRFAVPFAIQLWMFATPVVYPASLLDEQWRVIYGLNPMVGVVEGFRSALLGVRPPSTLALSASVVSAIALLVSGAYAFRRMERRFADVV